MSKKCTRKEKYRTYSEAHQRACKYMNDISLTFTVMEAYYCNKHACYHIGHNNHLIRYPISNLLNI